MSFLHVQEGECVEPSGDLCLVRIYASELLLVFLDQHLRVRIETSDEYPRYPAGVFEFESEAVVLQNLPLDGVQVVHKIAFSTLIARGWVMMLEDPEEGEEAPAAPDSKAPRLAERDRLTPARRLLAEARNYRIERLAERSREWYLDGIAVGLGLVWICGLLLWLTREGVEPAFGASVPQTLNAFVAGATGAALSVALRMGSIAVTPGISASLHWRESAARLFVGGMTALFASLLLRAGIVLAPTGASAGTALTLAIALVAGASERAFPSLAAKLPAIQPTAKD